MELAAALSWPGQAPPQRFVSALDRALGAQEAPRVLLVAGRKAGPWREWLAAAWPAASIELADPGQDPSATHVRLAARGPFDVVVHVADTNAVQQARVFQRVFMHLRTGGTYLTPTLLPLGERRRAAAVKEAAAEVAAQRSAPVWPNEDAQFQGSYVGDLWEMLSEALAARLRGFPDDPWTGVRIRDVRGLGRHLGVVRAVGRSVSVRLRGRVHVKLTEAETDRLLERRPDIGHELLALAPTTFHAEGSYRHNLPEDRYVGATFEVPKLTLREYAAPTCSRGQVVSHANLLLPDTFRHHLAPRLQNGRVRGATPLFGTVQGDLSHAEALRGTYFHLDSEWPGHFGHLLTEQLGRMWAWDQARSRFPDLRVLMAVQGDREPYELRPFEEAILGAFGIRREDVHLFRNACRPERLVAATSMFSLPDYVHPDIATVWDRVGDHLAARAAERPRPRRMFCTRPAGFKRGCHNAGEVEDLFAAHGFEIVRPELLPVAEQVAMFRAADVVGGFGGSALFTLALCPTPKRVFTIAPTSYTARNEHLIAAVRGHDLVSVWSAPDEPHPEGRWTQRAYASHFGVDMDAEGRLLAQELAALDG